MRWRVLAWRALAVAVLKYRLFDLDLIVNRALVYGGLTASVVGIYVLVVGYLGTLFRTGGNLPISLVATALVAISFQPLRDRLQRGANRLLYGQRDEPYAVSRNLDGNWREPCTGSGTSHDCRDRRYGAEATLCRHSAAAG